jgi:hypothetical protein
MTTICRDSQCLSVKSQILVGYIEASTISSGFFEEARSFFEDIVAWLGSDVVCGLEHEEIEKNLFLNGNELLRRLLQGYLDSRSDDEVFEKSRTRIITTLFLDKSVILLT